jgi:prepilin-type N-terminal cleavage/methylation domain-containing protein
MKIASSQVRRGFTLIELLVVIAIIGILSSIVLASLNVARDKSADAAIESNISNMRAQAQIYYDNNTASYLGVCTADPTGLLSAQNSINAVGGLAECTDTTDTWRLSSPMKTSSTTWWCADNTGTSTLKTSAPVGDAC